MAKQFFLRTGKILFEKQNSPLYKTNEFFRQYALLIYLVAILSFIILLPVFYEYIFDYQGIAIFALTLMFIAGLYIVSINPQIFLISVLLALMVAAILTINIKLANINFLLASLGLMVLFFILTMIAIIVQIFSSSKISFKELVGSMCVYLLMAIVWSLIFVIIEIIYPGSFYILPSSLDADLVSHSVIYPQFLYFSLVTVSTLGYGDIVPIQGVAQILSSLEAIVGQLYLTIMIARLVGLHVVIKNE